MARLQRKVTVWLAATGLGIVLAANPSGALPWGGALRPAFVTDALGAPGHAADADAGADPTIARPIGGGGASDDRPATSAAPATASQSTMSPSIAPSSIGPATPPPGEPVPTTSPTSGDAALRATAGTSAQPGDGDGGRPEPAEPPTEPTTAPTTTAPARRDDRTPSSLTLACRLQAGAARADVACMWSGATPDGAVKQLVLRGDGTVGRVVLSTDALDVRAFTDHDAGAGRSFSYVVVFLGADGKTVAHSNGVNLTTPAAPTVPTTMPPKPPTSEPKPPTSEPKPPTTTTATTAPAHHPEPTTTAPGAPH